MFLMCANFRCYPIIEQEARCNANNHSLFCEDNGKAYPALFPLDGRRGLTANIVNNPVNPSYGIDNFTGNMC